MADTGGWETRNIITGGTQYGPVLMGRDFRNVRIDLVQATAAPVALSQLPALAAGFRGRDAELAQISALLDRARDAGAVVVSAVAGLAGVGKTELAKQAGQFALEAGWFPGGVLFIDLHGYDDAPVQPGQALDALLRALGVAAEHIPPTAEERGALYRSALAQISDPVLIIADNASAEAQVRPLLPGPGPHRVVVTSRHTLAGLGARLLDVTVLAEAAAVAVLDGALRDARPGDDRIGADRVGAARLAGICGGLPLALQIATALLAADPSRTVSDLADELGDEVRRLEALRYDDGGGTSAPSVAAAFDLSYRQLDERAARVFRLLPVNPGPDLSTAAAAALADLPVSEVREVIGQLARAHLVEATAGAGRWRMHDLLRVYAQQLSQGHRQPRRLHLRWRRDGMEQARDRLLGYYVYMSGAAEAHLLARPGMPVPAAFTGRDDALTWLDAERPSLVAAISMAASTGRDQIAMQLPFSLVHYFDWRRRFDDLLATAMISKDAARRRGDRRREAAALENLGVALKEMRRFDEAITTHQDTVAIYRQIGDRHSEGQALDNLGNALVWMRLFDEAIAAQQDAVVIFREAGDRHAEGMALSNVGITLRHLGRAEEAVTACRDAVAIFRLDGDRHAEGKALDNLGVSLRDVGRAEEAVTAAQDAVAIFRETGDRHGEGRVLNNLGMALRDVGRAEEAVTAAQNGVAIFRETGDRHGEGLALSNLGMALRDLGRTAEAVTAHQDAVAIFRETGDRHSEGKALDNLGVSLRDVGRAEEAVTAAQNGVAIFRETGDRHSEGLALSNLGMALRDLGRTAEAVTAHQDAVAIFRETGDRHQEGLALENLELDRNAEPT